MSEDFSCVLGEASGKCDNPVFGLQFGVVMTSGFLHPWWIRNFDRTLVCENDDPHAEDGRILWVETVMAADETGAEGSASGRALNERCILRRVTWGNVSARIYLLLVLAWFSDIEVYSTGKFRNVISTDWSHRARNQSV